jgi:4-diphosphocytidyl-2-C-methyl-D-erythritol kinase
MKVTKILCFFYLCPMIFFPPAKINIGLKVLHKRSDGYHQLDTCMVPVPLHDVLEILPSKEFSFRQTGLTFDGANIDNLCIRAYKLLASAFDLPPVYMHLRKVIPMGAGLGGGSSDAAWVVKGLNILFELNLSTKQMEEYAVHLGSDCPFFIADLPQMAGGRGEQLSPTQVDLSGYFLKLVNPGLHIGTAEAYDGVEFSPDTPALLELLQLPLDEWQGVIHNDFEKSVFQRFPEISDIKEQLYAEGAIFSLMSGSGSTVYGVYKEEPKRTFTGKSSWMEVIRQFPLTV